MIRKEWQEYMVTEHLFRTSSRFRVSDRIQSEPQFSLHAVVNVANYTRSHTPRAHPPISYNHKARPISELLGAKVPNYYWASRARLKNLGLAWADSPCSVFRRLDARRVSLAKPHVVVKRRARGTARSWPAPRIGSRRRRPRTVTSLLIHACFC